MSRSDKVAVALRVAFISSINPEKKTARVKLPDLGEDVVSHELQILRRRSRGDCEYWMYDEGEEVWCLFCGHGLEDGIILGATYSDEDPLPVTDPDKHHVAYKDKTWFEYDRAAHKLSIHIEGEVDAYVKGLIHLVCDGDVMAKIAGRVQAEVEGDIAVESKKNISLKAGGDIDINASGNINLTAGGGIKGKASGIDWN